MGLKRYHAIRDFRLSPEPKGTATHRAVKHFVIQKHAARHLHYDFRLESNGVLLSWAVPKGLPLKRGERRLAVHVEDHPVAYENFEGIIPAGNYGGGTVMVWDLGTYEPAGNMRAMMKKGHIDFILHGKKLRGAWTLVRAKGLEGKDPWLILKRGEDHRPLSARQEDRSALSGRTMAQIGTQRDAVWSSSGKSRPKFVNPPRSALPAELKGLP